MRVVLSSLVAFGLAAVVQARYVCESIDDPASYPYCISIPDEVPADSCGGRMPVVLYLGGSGTKGAPTDVAEHTTYDGMGKLLATFRAGNTSVAAKLAGERFVTILPISPVNEPTNATQVAAHYWPDKIDTLLHDVKGKYDELLDFDRFHCAGYSMGSRGCWRYAVTRRHVFASSVNVGGGAESAGDRYILQEDAPPTFPHLRNIVHLPIRIIAETKDETAGTAIPTKTFDRLKELGSKSVSLEMYETDHEGLQTSPWNEDLLQWMLKQEKDGSKVCRHTKRRLA